MVQIGLYGVLGEIPTPFSRTLHITSALVRHPVWPVRLSRNVAGRYKKNDVSWLPRSLQIAYKIIMIKALEGDGALLANSKQAAQWTDRPPVRDR